MYFNNINFCFVLSANINYHLILINSDADFYRCTRNAYHKVKIAKSLNSKRENLLHMACKLNKPQFIKPLIGLKCEVFKQDLEGRTPLHVAMFRDNNECIEQFLSVLEICSNLNDDDDDDATVGTKHLTDNLIKMFKMYCHQGYTVVHMAVLKNLLHLLEVMLKFCQKYHINVLDFEVLGNGNSLLHLAVENHLHEITRVIVKNVPESLKFCNYGGYLAYAATDKTLVKQFKQVLVIL